ncbi:Grx4 family monothiol glutaredoxin [Buchnera aphidicola]|uniref:Glutaredoxin n=1 Tax=Buchnera aphidicola (Sarucallis kahawaluokalani) TaxID=1241878 RepID=A0A4D6Y8F6_9GAMM|nr:Grx4 family monothiol glutaredoxin [Buchnera aphidicola]QCI25937.1 Grx4 family monothiol glutaredoxin [Buchnera aphidicola (Sarucallis kahawaluokalani)]
MDVLKEIQQQIQNNSILLYMKGVPNAPSCGYSARAVEALSSCKVRFAYVNVLDHNEIRTMLPKYANWPTFPQLWVNGKLIGGCDIILQMLKDGELQELFKSINNK